MESNFKKQVEQLIALLDNQGFGGVSGAPAIDVYSAWTVLSASLAIVINNIFLSAGKKISEKEGYFVNVWEDSADNCMLVGTRLDLRQLSQGDIPFKKIVPVNLKKFLDTIGEEKVEDYFDGVNRGNPDQQMSPKGYHKA